MLMGDSASTQLTLSILLIRLKNYLCIVKRFIYSTPFLFFLFLSSWVSAQTYKSQSWSGNIYLGASNMMGDLGGSNFVGSRGIFDWDAKATRPAIGAGIAVHMGGVSLATNFLVTRLAGNDSYSNQEFQKDRNLSVRTDLVEADLLLEYRPWSRNKGFNRFYLYSGIGGIYYQPKAEYQGDWYKLRELGTEGQFLADGSGPYDELSLVIPYGLGYKFRLAKSTSLILDLGFRKTFTDYLDDVSGLYANPTLIGNEKGDVARELSNRSLTAKAINDERGNPDKTDSYHVLSIKFEYIFGGKSGDGCYYNRNPTKTRSTRINQRRMFLK
tara:strand:- start:9770 stop:10750 length:981 start_codon:yes stop_codon:yes gene_type:complete